MSVVVIKFNIDISLYQGEANIAASRKRKTSSRNTTEVVIPDILNNVRSKIHEILERYGFSLESGIPRSISTSVLGFSFYDTYRCEMESSDIKLILNVRISNHPAKPDLITRNDIRLEMLEKDVLSLDLPTCKLSLLDVYCKERNWGVEIFIGGNKDYTSVDSFERMEYVIDGKIRKLVQSTK